MVFDVFLCHNSQDKPEVIRIGLKLKEQGLKPWLDQWELRPGLPWQPELERQIQNIKSAAVFVGGSGIGPWQQREIEAYLRRFVRQGCPVIPVLLPNAPNQSELPLFLEGMTWVDFRHSLPEPMGQLIWGITGIKSGSPEPSQESGFKAFNFEIVGVNAKGEQIKKESKQSQYFSEDLGKDITLEMVAIPGGTFLMGTEDEEIERLVKKFNWEYFSREKPQHQVTVPPFYMGKYPITQAQWKAIASRADLKVKQDLDLKPAYFKDRPDSDRRPVEQVNWYDAIEFCGRLSKLTGREYRLPSEAEWEYACRAGTTTPFYFGETITGELANYNASDIYADEPKGEYDEPKGEYREQTTPVGQFPPNAFGLYDMHGNVWEWCLDPWHESYQDKTRTDSEVWDEEQSEEQYLLNKNNVIQLLSDKRTRVLRGGSWGSNPRFCRSALRNWFIPDNRFNDFGFRVVCRFPRT